jgi:parallel beta-helix repeat protein
LLSTLTVTNTKDRGPNSLRYEIAHASQNDTIVFAPKLDGQTITLTSGELAISTGLTIQGPGAGQLTISGNGSRVFEVNASAPVVLSGLTISNGNGFVNTGLYQYYGDGGGILNLSTLTLNGCVVSGNVALYGGASNFGGGIYNAGNLTLSGCTVSNNRADSAADTIGPSAFGGGIYNAGTLTVSNSTLSGNVAVYGDGGGIYVENAGTLTVSNSTLSDNVGAGSAIYMAGGNVTVTGCTLTDTPSGYGYLIWVGGGGLTVTNSSFHNPDGLYINGPYTDGGGNTFR